MGFDWRLAADLPMDLGFGQIPTTRHFERRQTPLWIATCGIHSNPRFYKYRWRIWTSREAIPHEALADFRQRFGPYPWLAIVPELSFNDAMHRMQELRRHGEMFMVMCERVKRADPEAPWDIARLRAQSKPVAPAYDDDPDVPFFGHK